MSSKQIVTLRATGLRIATITKAPFRFVSGSEYRRQTVSSIGMKDGGDQKHDGRQTQQQSRKPLFITQFGDIQNNHQHRPGKNTLPALLHPFRMQDNHAAKIFFIGIFPRQQKTIGQPTLFPTLFPTLLAFGCKKVWRQTDGNLI